MGLKLFKSDWAGGLEPTCVQSCCCSLARAKQGHGQLFPLSLGLAFPNVPSEPPAPVGAWEDKVKLEREEETSSRGKDTLEMLLGKVRITTASFQNKRGLIWHFLLKNCCNVSNDPGRIREKSTTSQVLGVLLLRATDSSVLYVICK